MVALSSRHASSKLPLAVRAKGEHGHHDVTCSTAFTSASPQQLLPQHLEAGALQWLGEEV